MASGHCMAWLHDGGCEPRFFSAKLRLRMEYIEFVWQTELVALWSGLNRDHSREALFCTSRCAAPVRFYLLSSTHCRSEHMQQRLSPPLELYPARLAASCAKTWASRESCWRYIHSVVVSVKFAVLGRTTRGSEHGTWGTWFTHLHNIWRFPKNMGTPKSSISVGFPLLNHSFGGTPIYWKPHMRNWFELHLFWSQASHHSGGPHLCLQRIAGDWDVDWSMGETHDLFYGDHDPYIHTCMRACIHT